MDFLNNAIKQNMLDSNQALKCLTELKVCHENVDYNIYFIHICFFNI